MHAFLKGGNEEKELGRLTGQADRRAVDSYGSSVCVCEWLVHGIVEFYMMPHYSMLTPKSSSPELTPCAWKQLPSPITFICIGNSLPRLYSTWATLKRSHVYS